MVKNTIMSSRSTRRIVDESLGMCTFPLQSNPHCKVNKAEKVQYSYVGDHYGGRDCLVREENVHYWNLLARAGVIWKYI